MDNLSFFKSILETVYSYMFFAHTNTNDQSYWTSIAQIVQTIWGYRPPFSMEIALMAIIVGLITVLLNIVKFNNDIQAPRAQNLAAYKTDLNINVWLNQVDDYFEANRIQKDSIKQAILLQKLDRIDRRPLQKLIDTKQIKSYPELIETVQDLYGTDTHPQEDHVLQLITRKQHLNESLGKFYGELLAMVKRAYPKFNAQQQDQQVAERFSKGLNNTFIKQKITEELAKNPKTDVLARAIQIHREMGDTINEYNTLQTQIDTNHIVLGGRTYMLVNNEKQPIRTNSEQGNSTNNQTDNENQGAQKLCQHVSRKTNNVNTNTQQRSIPSPNQILTTQSGSVNTQ